MFPCFSTIHLPCSSPLFLFFHICRDQYLLAPNELPQAFFLHDTAVVTPYHHKIHRRPLTTSLYRLRKPLGTQLTTALTVAKTTNALSLFGVHHDSTAVQSRATIIR